MIVDGLVDLWACVLGLWAVVLVAAVLPWLGHGHRHVHICPSPDNAPPHLHHHLPFISIFTFISPSPSLHLHFLSIFIFTFNVHPSQAKIQFLCYYPLYLFCSFLTFNDDTIPSDTTILIFLFTSPSPSPDFLALYIHICIYVHTTCPLLQRTTPLSVFLTCTIPSLFTEINKTLRTTTKIDIQRTFPFHSSYLSSS